MDRADDLREVLGASAPAAEGPLSDLGEAALRFARYGWMVFPCRPREKAPACPHGLLDAKRDEAAIREFWLRHPDMNVAVRTGAASNIVVLDIDGDEGWDSLHDLEDRNDDLPSTATVTTPRGGQHIYFQHPGVEIKNTTSFPGWHLDVRGDGGYVLAPPSVGPGGNKYELDERAPIAPMPAWLTAMLVKHQQHLEKTLASGQVREFFTNGATTGNRNDRLFRFACSELAHGRQPADVLAITQAMNAAWVKPPLPEDEVHKLVLSAAKMRARRAA